MLLCTLRAFKGRLHHRRLIRVVVLVGRAIERLNIELVYVLQIGIHCLEEEGTTFLLAPVIHRTVVRHGEYNSSGW